jgi:hypothetical protein
VTKTVKESLAMTTAEVMKIWAGLVGQTRERRRGEEQEERRRWGNREAATRYTV